jgi:hypothetical protein
MRLEETVIGQMYGISRYNLCNRPCCKTGERTFEVTDLNFVYNSYNPTFFNDALVFTTRDHSVSKWRKAGRI